MGRSLSRFSCLMLTADHLPLPTANESARRESGRWPLGRLPFILVLPIFAACLPANPPLTVSSVVVAAILPLLLWRPGEPPVLLFCCALQWLQVTTVLHYANFAGANLVSAFGG